MTPNFKQKPILYTGKTELIRQLPCVMPGAWEQGCCEGVDPAHYTTGSHAGYNLKNDRRILPLCRMHHTIQGSKGEKSFWFPRGHDARELADLLHILYLEGELGLFGEEWDQQDSILRHMKEACERFAA